MWIWINLFYGSERAYKKKFNEWQFPKKHSPLWEDQKLVSIICTTWKNNMNPSDMIYGLTFHGYILTIRQLKEVRLHPAVTLLTGWSNINDPNKNQMKLKAAIESVMSSEQGLRWGWTYLEAALWLDGLFISQWV